MECGGPPSRTPSSSVTQRAEPELDAALLPAFVLLSCGPTQHVGPTKEGRQTVECDDSTPLCFCSPGT